MAHVLWLFQNQGIYSIVEKSVNQPDLAMTLHRAEALVVFAGVLEN
jgi:hypothetical protein